MSPIENQTQSAENIAPQTPINHTRLIILTVVMILLGLLADTYFIFQNKSPALSVVQNQIILTSATTTTDQFVGWKTYTNSKYGFELKYPSVWNLSEDDQLTYSTIFFGGNNLQVSVSNELVKETEICQQKKSAVSIGTEQANWCSDGNPDDRWVTFINQQKAGATTGITFYCWFPVTQNNKGVCDQILSTFKFISILVPITNTNNSGISGTVTIGPTCPVERIPPDPQCADRSYQAAFNVKNQSGQVVKNFNSDATGKFSVDVMPGTYTISSATNQTLPRFSPQTVLVTKDKYTTINLQFDSGIR